MVITGGQRPNCTWLVKEYRWKIVDGHVYSAITNQGKQTHHLSFLKVTNQDTHKI